MRLWGFRADDLTERLLSFFGLLPFFVLYVAFGNFENYRILSLALETMAADSVVEPGYAFEYDGHVLVRIVTVMEAAAAISLLYGMQASTETGRTLVLITLVAALAVQYAVQPIYHYYLKDRSSGRGGALEKV